MARAGRAARVAPARNRPSHPQAAARPPRAARQPAGSGVDAGWVELGGAADDEVPPGPDLAAHEQVEHRLGGRRVLDPDPAQYPLPRIHGGLRELVRVHLAEALVALRRFLEPLPLALQLDHRAAQLGVAVGVNVLGLALARV